MSQRLSRLSFRIMASFCSHPTHRICGAYLVDVADIGAAVASDSLLLDKALAALAAESAVGEGTGPFKVNQPISRESLNA